MQTAIVKGMKAKGAGYDYREGEGGIPFHYDIKKGSSLCSHHLLSLLLYTDYTDLSSNFSSSFRKTKTFETLKNIKKRNSAYFFMSKHLRELVEVYGQCSFGEYKGTGLVSWSSSFINKMSGYFYCGMSVAMNIPSFSMRLCSPTSTSMQLSVALKFSGRDGMVITLNNPTTTDDKYGHPTVGQYSYLRGFNCCWISRYKEEDERYDDNKINEINVF